MNKQVLENAIEQIKQDKAKAVSNDLQKAQAEYVIPKLQEIDKEKQELINAENVRHLQAIEQIEKQANDKKAFCQNDIKAEIERLVEEREHFDTYIKALEDIIGK